MGGLGSKTLANICRGARSGPEVTHALHSVEVRNTIVKRSLLVGVRSEANDVRVSRPLNAALGFGTRTAEACGELARRFRSRRIYLDIRGHLPSLIGDGQGIDICEGGHGHR